MNSEVYIYFKCPDCGKDKEEYFNDEKSPNGAINLIGHKEIHCDCGCSLDVEIKGEICIRKQQ